METRWGSWEVVHENQVHGVKTKVLNIKKGMNLSYQRHFKREEVWFIAEGWGVFADDVGFKMIEEGDHFTVPLESWHSVRAMSDMKIFEVQIGSETVEEDIERMFMDWEEISDHFLQSSGGK